MKVVQRHESLSVPLISADALKCFDSSKAIGSGRFGSCYRMIFKDAFEVCVKRFDSLTSIDAIKAEAEIMVMLNTRGFTPHCFGICVDMHALIMMNITVQSLQISLYGALSSTISGFSLTAESSKICIVNICNGLSFIHKMQILHNDLKLDNVVLGTSISGQLKVFIVDFGKACKAHRAKKYKLSEEERATYLKEHTQVAPDLRDGLLSRSTHSDVYSLGRIMNTVNRKKTKSKSLVATIKQCLSYHSHDRPSLQAVLGKLME